MDFTNRNGQPQQIHQSEVKSVNAPQKNRLSNKDSVSKLMRVGYVILLFSVTILVIALSILFYLGGNGESKYIQTKDFQAVDINVNGLSATDQIYFGHIKSISNTYIVLNDVYFFQTAQGASGTPTSGASSTLQPLICEIHAPYDQMIINRSNVNWWENLQPSGKVAKTISLYEQNNPNGPNCPQPAATPSTSSTTPTTTPTKTP